MPKSQYVSLLILGPLFLLSPVVLTVGEPDSDRVTASIGEAHADEAEDQSEQAPELAIRPRPGRNRRNARPDPNAGGKKADPVDTAKPVKPGQELLSPWFRDLDEDEDGQVSLFEWRKGEKKVGLFRDYDLNDDGFITTEEFLRQFRPPSGELAIEKGQLNYTGLVEESTDELYQGKKSFKFLNIKLEKGKTYQIEQTSKIYFAYLYLEDPDGALLDKHNSGGVGLTARIVHRVTRTGIYRIVATSEGGFRTGEFSLSVRVVPDPGDAWHPGWFLNLDKDEDGQVSLFEWRSGGRKLDDFGKYDLDEDGFITERELLLFLKSSGELAIEDGRLSYNGIVEESTEENYQGKKSFKLLTVRFEKGKTYQIEHTSKVFYAYLYMEDPDGKLLTQNNSGGRGQNSRIVHRATRSGAYRIIATSQDGYRTGEFSLSIRVVPDPGDALHPAWFHDLDKDEDGQISLYEWRIGGKKLEEFRDYDVDNDGFITTQELVQKVRPPSELKLENGKLNYNGIVEESPEELFRGRKCFKPLYLRLEKGKTYLFEYNSQEFYPNLYLEDPEGMIVERHNSGGRGQASRIVHCAARSSICRVVATSQDGVKTGAFSLSIRVVPDTGGGLFPAWYRDLDTDEDGQISLFEWRTGGKKLEEFRDFDLDNDGFITARELLEHSKPPDEFKIENGQANTAGILKDSTTENYQGKTSFKVLTIKLEKGKTYQFDYLGKEFSAYLYLEDPEGTLVDKNKSPGLGQNSRIVYRATRTGNYRLVATNQESNKPGAFTLSVRAVPDVGGAAWFKNLDTDDDGQISLYEWRVSGRKLEEFREYDQNDDGFITAEELLRYLKPTNE